MTPWLTIQRQSPAFGPRRLPPSYDTIHGTVGYFSSGWPVAYLVATVIFGIGLLIGSLMPVSEPAQLPAIRPSPPSPPPLPSMVGRITGMVDCQWEVQGQGQGSETPLSAGRGARVRAAVTA